MSTTDRTTVLAPLVDGAAASIGGERRSASAARRELFAVYRSALRRYVPRDGGLAARSIERTDDGWVVSEPCALNTAELARAAALMDAHGLAPAIDARMLLDRLMDPAIATADYGTVALALWAAALARSPHAARLWATLGEKLPRDASQSMALAWTLSAACALTTAVRNGDVSGVDPASLDRLSADVYQRMCRNQHADTDLFHPSGLRTGLLRRRVSDATLSSQSYPILSFTTYGQLHRVPDALERARRCADRLVTLQGPRGQWWWRYDVRRGAVGQRYPVYCVNQDAAMPSALGQLQSALGETRYDGAIARGLAWEAGDNEADRPLIDAAGGFVARSLEVTPAGVRCSWEMYGYQPARFISAVLSNPAWAAEVTA